MSASNNVLAITRLWAAACTLIAALLPGFAHAQVAFLQDVAGTVRVTLPGGRVIQGTVGDTFPNGTRIEVGDEATVTLKFADGQVLVLRPHTRLLVAQYRFDPANLGASTSSLVLEGGAMRFVGGVIAVTRPEAVRVNAGTAAVSIRSRGVDFIAVVQERAQDIGSATVVSGEIAVVSAFATAQSIESEEFGAWAPGQSPRPPLPLIAAPAALQAHATALRTVRLPDTGPVVIASAARAAAAVAAARQAQAAAAQNPGNAGLLAAAQAAEQQAQAAVQSAAADSSQLAIALINSLPSSAAGLKGLPTVARPVDASFIAPLSGITPPVSGCIGSPC